MRLAALQTSVLPTPAEFNSAWQLTDQQFLMLRVFAHKHAGINLNDHKRNMVQRRVARRVAHIGLPDIKAYCDLLESAAGTREIEHLINVLTTNKTDFFRENHHFEHLGKYVLPAVDRRLSNGEQKRLRIWSAGCSSGQEAYTIGITMMATMPELARQDAKILATDIDTEILAKAENGIYNNQELSVLPPGMKESCFSADVAQDGNCRIAPDIQKLVSFRHLNLHAPWPMAGQFDVIFCRNVVIYFDKPTQVKLFDRFANILAPNGYIYIGHSESLFKVSDRFQFEGQSIYRKIA
jgi:chemotaxis protein methyltransferase CheR